MRLSERERRGRNATQGVSGSTPERDGTDFEGHKRKMIQTRDETHLLSFNHFLKKCLLIVGSASKMATGTARSVTGAP